MNLDNDHHLRRNHWALTEGPFDSSNASKADWKHWVNPESIDAGNVLVAAREGRKGAVYQEKSGVVIAGEKKILNVCQDSLNVFRGNYKKVSI